MNPVRCLTQTVQRILSYPGASEESSICTYLFEGKLKEFTQDDIIKVFKANATAIGKDTLGYTEDDICTHSNRSAAAMAMFVDHTLVYIIMLMGR